MLVARQYGRRIATPDSIEGGIVVSFPGVNLSRPFAITLHQRIVNSRKAASPLTQ